MIKLMKYLKRSAGYVALIIALLFLQAYCDLSLPDYTSKIVNVGIQQKGIEDGVPEKIRKTSLDGLALFMSEEDALKIKEAYTEKGSDYQLKKDISKEKREELNEIFGKPMLITGRPCLRRRRIQANDDRNRDSSGKRSYWGNSADAQGCKGADDGNSGRKI